MSTKKERLKYAEHDANAFRKYCLELAGHFHTIKKMEIEDTDNRDALFAKELVYAIEGCGTIIEVLARHGEIHPSYALEKLKNAEGYVAQAIRHFESKHRDE